MNNTFTPGYPKSKTGIEGTWRRTSSGGYKFKQRLTALSPLAVKSCNFLRLWIPLLAMAYQGLILWQYEFVPIEVWGRCLVFPWLLYPASHAIFSVLFKSTCIVEFKSNEISINTGSGWQNFDRNVAHEFKAITHEKEVAERDKRMAARKRYYQKSRVITLIHAGLDIPILEVFEVRKAERMVSQLKANEEWLEGTSQRGNGLVQSSHQRFSLQPGGLQIVPPHLSEDA